MNDKHIIIKKKNFSGTILVIYYVIEEKMLFSGCNVLITLTNYLKNTYIKSIFIIITLNKIFYNSSF